jgi:molybdopterin-guanine dinucleotide biosynthesis protein A
MSAAKAVLGVVLAGGAGRRIGGGKAWRRFAGRPLIQHTIDRIGPQVGALALSGSADDPRLAVLGLPLLADTIAEIGPLGGILAALNSATALLPGCRAVLIVPVDCPFLPDELVRRLADGMAAAGAMLAYAVSGERAHPTVGLWSPVLAAGLAGLVREEGIYRVGAAVRRLGGVPVPFEQAPVDPFFNVNSPDDLARAEAMHEALAAYRS